MVIVMIKQLSTVTVTGSPRSQTINVDISVPTSMRQPLSLQVVPKAPPLLTPSIHPQFHIIPVSKNQIPRSVLFQVTITTFPPLNQTLVLTMILRSLRSHQSGNVDARVKRQRTLSPLLLLLVQVRGRPMSNHHRSHCHLAFLRRNVVAKQTEVKRSLQAATEIIRT